MVCCLSCVVCCVSLCLIGFRGFRERRERILVGRGGGDWIWRKAGGGVKRRDKSGRKWKGKEKRPKKRPWEEKVFLRPLLFSLRTYGLFFSFF